MPAVHTLAQQVVEQIYRELPRGVAELRITSDPEYLGLGYHIELIPASSNAAKISVNAPKDSWNAYVGCGKYSHCEIWYRRKSEADQLFKEDLRVIIKTIIISHWQERVIFLGEKFVSCLTVLPPPVGPWRSSWGFTGWLGIYVPFPGRTEKIINWEPYVRKEHGVREKVSPTY